MASFRDNLKEFADLSRRYPSELRRLKNRGKKVVCWYGSYIPKEIICASGALQYPLFDGGDPEPPSAALQYLLFCINVQARYQVGQHVMGLNPITPIADRIIIDAKGCDDVRVGDAFEYLGLPVMKLGVPQDWEKEIAFKYYKKQLGRLKEELEELTEEEITNRKLVEAVRKYNEIRQLLDEIRRFRMEKPPVIGGEDFVKLNHYALRCDPDVAIGHLKKISENLDEEKSKFSENAPRILLVGRGFAFGDYTLPRMIEKLGGVVAIEFLDEAMIHLERVKTNGNLMENIAERYYRAKVPSCLLNPSFSKRWEYVSKLIEEYHIDGLIYYLLSFDVVYDYEYPIFAKKAEEKGIPFTMIDSAYDFSREATETLRTRVESFIRMLRDE